MKYFTAVKLTRGLAIASAVLCVGGLMFTGNLAALRAVLTAAALLCLVSGLIVTLTFCKCPSCGKHIFFGAAKVVYCPNCRRSLETGKKVSKKRANSTFKK